MQALIDPIVQIYASNPILAGLATLIAVAVAAVIIYQEKYSEDEFDETSVEERVKGQLDEVARLFGKKPKKALTHGFSTLGKVSKALVVNSVTHEFDPSKDEIEEITPDEDPEDSDAYQSLAVLKVRPMFKHDPGRFFSWFIAEELLNVKEVHDLAVTKLDTLEIGEEIFIPPRVNFTKTAGVYVEDTDDGQAFIRETAFQDILNDSLTTFGNVVELMNVMNIEYSMDISRLEKELEIMKEMDDSDKSSISRVNNG